MMTTMRTDFCLTALPLLLLLVSAANGYTEQKSLLGARGGDGGATGEGERREMGERQRRGGSGCEEGWVSTHHYCLLYTGMGEEEAEVFCAQKNALQVRGICLTKPSPPEEDVLNTDTESMEDLDTLTPSSSSSSSSSSSPGWGQHCPSGWVQMQNYCYLNPGPASKICELLGAHYVFNLCVAKVPHQIPGDFLHAVKRLHGDDNHLERNTRLCCCLGGGLCK